LQVGTDRIDPPQFSADRKAPAYKKAGAFVLAGFIAGRR
jgi:hypothetical protein